MGRGGKTLRADDGGGAWGQQGQGSVGSGDEKTLWFLP